MYMPIDDIQYVHFSLFQIISSEMGAMLAGEYNEYATRNIMTSAFSRYQCTRANDGGSLVITHTRAVVRVPAAA